MSRAHQFDRYAEQEEARLAADYEAGRISREEYNTGLRDLQREARDAYQTAMGDAADRVRDEWGGW